MRKNKKGSLELGVNSIVILIIAMAVLGLIIYFIYKNLQPDIPPLPVQPAAAPDSTNTITTSPPELAGKAADKIQTRINVFNPTDAEVAFTDLRLKCNNLPDYYKIEINPATIDSLAYKEFTAVFQFPRAAKDKHLCQFRAYKTTFDGENVEDGLFTSKDVVIEIK